MSEYIGSRISLISKSDIKYIGTLHEINSENHTVALESVTSYGTEGRKGNPAEEIPGSNHVYEYIVFRGSDVKELTIVAPPGEREKEKPQMPDDPAILGSARPQNQPPPQQQQQQQPQPPAQNQFRGPQPPYPQQHPQYSHFGPPPPNQFQNQPRFQGPGGPHGFPGSPGAVPGYSYGGPPPPGYPMPYNGPPPPGPYGHPFPPGHGPPPQGFQSPPSQPPNQQRPPQHMQGQQQPPIGRKQGTPQPQQNQQPPPEQQAPKPVEMSATPGPASELSQGPPPPVESKPSVAAATAPAAASNESQQQPPRGPQNNKVAVPLAPKQRSTPSAQTQAPPPAPPQSFADATQAATAAVAAAMAKLGNTRPQTDGTTDNLTQKVNQMRINDQQQRGRGPRGRCGPTRGGPRSRPVEVPKEDYDFESANAKFNKQELVKEAIASGSPNPLGSPTANGDGGDPLAATAGAVNGHTNGDDEKDGDDHVVIPPAEKGYDKKSSFFDNISSDLKDRTEQAQDRGAGFDGRAMRSQERSKNMETFGQSNVDGGGYRGGFRGRGRGYGHSPNYRGSRGYGRGRGGYERGGYPGRGRGQSDAPVVS